MKYCTKCGTPCEDGFTFCPKCGNEMASIVEPAPVEEPAATAPCEVSANVAAANAAIASVLAPKAPVEEPVEQPVQEETTCEVEQPAEETTVVATEVVAAEVLAKETVSEEENDEPEDDQTGYVFVEDKIPEGGKGRGLAGVAFAFGLMSLLFFWIPGVNIVMFILSILGIILSSAAMKHYKYGLAIAGKVLSIFALVFNLILVAIFAIAVISGFSYFKGVADTFTLYSTQATGLIDTVGKFLSDVFLVK